MAAGSKACAGAGHNVALYAGRRHRPRQEQAMFSISELLLLRFVTSVFFSSPPVVRTHLALPRPCPCRVQTPNVSGGSEIRPCWDAVASSDALSQMVVEGLVGYSSLTPVYPSPALESGARIHLHTFANLFCPSSLESFQMVGGSRGRGGPAGEAGVGFFFRKKVLLGSEVCLLSFF